MSEKTNPEANLHDQFRAFGQNLKKAMNAAWNSEEKQQTQADIEAGINELGKALNEFVTSFRDSETGQKIVNEVDELGDRIRNGEVQQKAEEGLLTVLQKLNSELEKAAERFSPEPEEE